ncbi:hypothetical protein BLNAU_9503 [Blattamonas nauphoetae]|uniref:Uncharacterized protein n=1 Tax=Blattamonas nauphoetae TaxID=2049346 RepID=A0ABQ9XVG6_9EUKA|nr:hypothetical protein BLNAU_9503 [Blattamonas nauphoetae]
MNDEAVALSSSTDVSLSDTSESPSTVKPEEEPFLDFDPKTELSFEDLSKIYNSLVALVKAGYPFDKALQDKAVQFLESLDPTWDKDLKEKLALKLVPTSDGSPSGFIASIVTLLSSPHSTVVTSALSFLFNVTVLSSPAIQCPLVDSDLISNVLAILQPHTLQMSGNEDIFGELFRIVGYCGDLASPSSLSNFGITAAVDKSNYREMIFRKVVLPSSQFVTFLISNRYILNGDLLKSFMMLLDMFIKEYKYFS